MKTIPNFPNYAVTKDGRVWSKPRKGTGCDPEGKWLRPGLGGHGYYTVALSNGIKRISKSIHTLVLETFVGPCPPGMEACHNNGNRTDNRLSNLRWDGRSNNYKDSRLHNTNAKGTKHGHSKLTESNVRMIIYMYRTGLFLQREIAEIYNVSRATVTYIINKRSWNYMWGGKIQPAEATQ